MINHKITEGLSTIFTKESGMSDNLTNYSETLDYLVSTPAIFAMIIEASSEMLDPLLPEDFITVGKNIELSHVNPTVVGGTISLVITVTKVESNRIYLEFTGHDSIGLICKGKYERAIVNQTQLMEIAYRRAESKL